jgi:ATPase subunit of ABC transporter with duplicated ATPase domains
MIDLRKVSYETGGRKIIDNVSFSINERDRLGLVGRNGVGKTTLLHLMSGDLQPTSGEIIRNNHEIGLLPQDMSDWLDYSIIDFVKQVTGVKSAEEQFDASCQRLEKTQDDNTLMIYADALDKYNRFEVADFDHRLEAALEKAKLKDVNVYREIGQLSGGQKTRVALAALFSSRYDAILLDEPTNNLDTEGIAVLEKFIGESSATFVLVSHDRRFLRNIATRIIELTGGDPPVHQYDLGYDEYMERRDADRAAIQNSYDKYETEKKRLKRAEREAHIRANSAAHGSRASDGDKLTNNFRKERAASSIARAAGALTSRAEQLIEPERPQEAVDLKFAFQNESEKRVNLLTVNDLTVNFHEKILGPVSFSLQNGEHILLNGPNGSGKTSLLRAIVGQIPASDGQANYGSQTRTIYVNQNQDVPEPQKSAIENLKALAPHLEPHEIINTLLRFGIAKNAINTQADSLSGGERAKILLAGIAANQANLLIMDEPTNNLDIPTVEALENALRGYVGGVLLVSHDRDFVNSLKIDREIHL